MILHIESATDMGAGWRVYFPQRGMQTIVLLVGGSKRTQKADIKRAKALWADAQPRFDTISRACAALGVRLVAEPVHTRSKRIASGQPS